MARHLLGHIGLTLYYVLECVVAGIAYQTPCYELIENFARVLAIAQVGHYGSADCRFESFRLIVEFDPHCGVSESGKIFLLGLFSRAHASVSETVLSYRGPHGQPHLMVTGAAMVDSDVCIAAFGKSLDAGDFHLFSAPTCRAFGTAGL